jgi:hypothetical protein
LKHVIFPAKIQISKPIDVSVFMFDLRMINMSSEWQYDWYWKISACSTEYEVCDSFASLTRKQSSYSGSACWYFRYQSIHIQITYTYRYFVVFSFDLAFCDYKLCWDTDIWYTINMLYRKSLIIKDLVMWRHYDVILENSDNTTCVLDNA